MTTLDKRVLELGGHIISSGVGQTWNNPIDRKHIKNKAEANILKIYWGNNLLSISAKSGELVRPVIKKNKIK